MNPNWAEENLQTIRTLMERSAVYRRALAPVMTFAGAVGTLTAAIGWVSRIDTETGFVTLWFCAAAVAVTGAFLFTRRQALKDEEPFWSPPTRRVAQALAPFFAVGLFVSLLLYFDAKNASGHDGTTVNPAMAGTWIFFYGCALHAAGFFMPRGIRWFGLLFIACVCGMLLLSDVQWLPCRLNANWLMGFFFGVLHLAYGGYLYLTEKKINAA